MLGMDGWMSVARESTFGTAPGSGEKYARIIREDLKYNPSPKIRRGMSGAGRRVKFLGRVRVGGPLMFETHYEGIIGEILYSALGQKGVSGTNPYTHTFTAINTGDLPSLNVEVSKGDTPTGTVFRYDGCMVDKLAIIFEDEETVELEATLGCKDRTGNVSASGTPSYPGEYPIEFWHLTSTGITLAGNANVEIRGGRIEVMNNLDLDRFLMKRTLSKPRRKNRRQVTLSCEVEFEDMSLVDDLTAGTEGGFLMTWTSDLDIPSSSPTTPFSMSCLATTQFIASGEPVIGDEGQIILPITADLLETASASLQVSLVNGETSYT